MISRAFHPSAAALSRYAAVPDGEAVARHLASCQRCRDHVTFARELEQRAATLDGPPAAGSLLARIHARLDAGEQLILPDAESAAGVKPNRSWLAAAAVVVFAAAGMLVWSTPNLRAGAGAGELRFTPGRLAHGAIAVEYVDGGLFAGAAELELRARYRTPGDQAYNQSTRQLTVARLQRDSHGTYRASIEVPDSVVYAAFAVESSDGARVDDNGHRLWYLLAYDSTGRPTQPSLAQRANDLMGENSELALQVIQERARLYPDSPQPWSNVVSFERIALGQAHDDSMAPLHCARLQRLDSVSRAAATVSASDAEALRDYTVELDDEKCPAARAIARFWTDRVLADSVSGAPEAELWRYETQVKRVWSEPARAAAVAEQFWPATGDLRFYVLKNGRNFSREAKDGRAALRWADRNVAWEPAQAVYAYNDLLAFPEVRDSALGRLRAVARRLLSRQDSLRPLEHTVAQQARIDSAAARRVFATIGRALVEDGHLAAGRDTLELAVVEGWDPQLFRQVADLQLRIGDTTRAAALLARVVVDPSTGTATSDSLNRFVRNTVPAFDWSGAQRTALDMMRRETLADAVSIGLHQVPSVTRADSGSERLSDVAGGRVTVVTFWSERCAPSRQQFPELRSLGAALKARGIALVPITGAPPSAEVRAYVDSVAAGLTVYHDQKGEAMRAFENFGTPTYFVLDGKGRIRFRYSSLDKVLTQAAVLQQSEN